MVRVKNLPRRAQKAFWARVGGKYRRVKKKVTGRLSPRSDDTRVNVTAVRKKMLSRSKHAKAADMARTARIVLHPRSNLLHVWMENPELVDVEGVDTEGSSLADIRRKLQRAVQREQRATRRDVEDIRKREQEIEREQEKERPDSKKITKESRAIRGQVKKGLRRRMRAYFDIGRYKKQMARHIASEGDMTYLEVVHLINLAPREYDRPADTIDWYSHIDPTLTYEENKAILQGQLDRMGGYSAEELSRREVDWMEDKYEDEWRDYVRRYAEEEAQRARQALKSPERYFESVYGRPPATEEDRREVEELREDAREMLREIRSVGAAG